METTGFAHTNTQRGYFIQFNFLFFVVIFFSYFILLFH